MSIRPSDGSAIYPDHFPPSVMDLAGLYHWPVSTASTPSIPQS